MLKKILFILIAIPLIASTSVDARRGFGSGFGLGLLGGALITSAAYNNYPSYGYYPAAPYAYGPPMSYYGYQGYNPYW